MFIIELNERRNKASELIRETKIANFAKLANMLIDLFGIPEAFKKYVKPKREGQQVEMVFKAIQDSLIITLTQDKNKFHALYGKANNPVAFIVFNVKREKLAIEVGKLIRLKSNIFGLISLVPKLLTRKLIIKGSLFGAIAAARIMMIGKNDVYKDI